MNNHNLNDSFEKLLADTFFIYSGLRFERTPAGFIHNGILCRDTHDMDILVEQERLSLGNSISSQGINVK